MTVYDEAIIQYQVDTIHTLSEDELGLMLFEAALRHARYCQRAIDEGSWDLTVVHGGFVQNVMAGLVDTMNRDHPQAEPMRQLYLYCWRQAIRAQMEHHREDLDAVVQVLENLIAGIKGHLHRNALEEIPPAESINFSG